MRYAVFANHCTQIELTHHALVHESLREASYLQPSAEADHIDIH